jgi:hypothetical protein
MPWTSVTIVDDYFEEIITPFYVEGSVYQLVVGAGHRTYNCHSDVNTVPDAALIADDGTTAVAQNSDPYSDLRPRALPISRKAKRINGSPKDIQVTVEYHDPTGNEAVEDLLALPAKITSGPTNVREEYQTDCDDTPKPVVNAAGEPFDKNPERLSAGRKYTIVKYVTEAQKAAIRAQEHTNNAGAVTIDGFVHADNTLLIQGTSFEPVEDFHKAAIEVLYDPSEWEDDLLNVGFSELDADTGLRKDITQKEQGAYRQAVAAE